MDGRTAAVASPDLRGRPRCSSCIPTTAGGFGKVPWPSASRGSWTAIIWETITSSLLVCRQHGTMLHSWMGDFGFSSRVSSFFFFFGGRDLQLSVYLLFLTLKKSSVVGNTDADFLFSIVTCLEELLLFIIMKLFPID